jgi:hypothetical protein
VPPLQLSVVQTELSLQLVLHAPQFAPSVFVFTSQPLAMLPSQLAKPELQLVMVQVPVEQDAVALAGLQAVPHAPQLVRELSWVSQPLVAFPSQSP